MIHALLKRHMTDEFDPEVFSALSSNPVFLAQAEALASRFAVAMYRVNKRAWKTIEEQSRAGRLIYEGIEQEMQGPIGSSVQAIVRENAKLISSLPEELAAKANAWIAEQQRAGVRSEALQQRLMKRFPDLTSSRIRLIARTETAKGETALTQARAQSLDLNWYQWSSSQDERVRKSHRKMNDVLVNWSEPPSPEQLIGEPGYRYYHAGSTFNCRCAALPLVNLDEVTWPHRVYRGGRITTVTRVQFKRLSGIQEAA